MRIVNYRHVVSFAAQTVTARGDENLVSRVESAEKLQVFLKPFLSVVGSWGKKLGICRFYRVEMNFYRICLRGK